MTARTYASEGSYSSYPTQGSLALKRPYPVRFVVIEGGRGRSDSAPDGSGALARQGTARRVAAGPAQGNRALVATALIVGMALVASLALSSLTARTVAQALDAAGSQEVVVQSGDTLWDLARAHAVEGTSVEDVVSWIEDHNDVDPGHLRVGQTIKVPGRV